MDKETATLMQEITAFEKQLDAGSPRRARKTVSAEKESKLASDIAEVESLLAGMTSTYMEEIAEPGCGEAGMDEEWGMDEETGMDEEQGMLYMDELGMDDLIDDEYDADEEVGFYASEVDQSGIEEQITDDHFSEVERVTGDDSIPDAEHTFDVAPTESDHVASANVAGMKAASERLDKLASYIENKVKQGENKQWLKVAYRIDQMADSIDARIKATEAE